MPLEFNMEIKSDTRNELFKRNEMGFELESEKNPSFDEMGKQISEEIKKPEENINVYNIKGNFGSNQFKIDAYVYDSKEDLEKAEQKTQKQRKAEVEDAKKAAKEKLVEEAPAEEKAAEEKKEKALAEEVKDETPVEEKAEQVEEKPAEEKGSLEASSEAPVESPAEDKPEEEAKADKEEKQGKEEAKEN